MCCPHYQEELDRRPSLHKILKKRSLHFVGRLMVEQQFILKMGNILNH